MHVCVPQLVNHLDSGHTTGTTKTCPVVLLKHSGQHLSLLIIRFAAESGTIISNLSRRDMAFHNLGAFQRPRDSRTGYSNISTYGPVTSLKTEESPMLQELADSKCVLTTHCHLNPGLF